MRSLKKNLDFSVTKQALKADSHSAVFFSHNKSANNNFCYSLSAK